MTIHADIADAAALVPNLDKLAEAARLRREHINIDGIKVDLGYGNNGNIYARMGV